MLRACGSDACELAPRPCLMPKQRMQHLLVVALTLSAISLILTVITHVAVVAIRRRSSQARVAEGISVLKPLKGVDDDLYDNLASLARQEYPLFELLFGCEDPHDPALVVARRIQRDFPGVAIRIFVNTTSFGLNPKVNNLRMLSREARYDLLLISDSNVRVSPQYLAAMADELFDERVGLVSSVLVGSGENSLGARLDNLHMNSFVVRAVCSSAVFSGPPCVIGKSMLFRASVFEKLGGLGVAANVLAEDYVIARAFADAGYSVALSSHPVQSVSVHRSLGEFLSRHLRWSQMRRQLLPAVYLAEPLQSPLPWLSLSFALIAAGAAPEHGSALVALIGFGFVIRLASDAWIVARLRGASLDPIDAAAIVLKDVLFIGVWVVGAFKRRVCWRGVQMRIGRGSRLTAEAEPGRRYGAFERA